MLKRTGNTCSGNIWKNENDKHSDREQFQTSYEERSCSLFCVMEVIMAKDIETMVAKEIEKGATSLKLSHLYVAEGGIREIESREKLLDVLQYLLRIKEYRKIIWNDTLSANNVYMDSFLGKTNFHRAALFTDRETIYQHINWYGGKLKPDYDGRTIIETCVCAFSISAEELERCRKTYQGKEAYSFYLGKYQIRSLYADCLEYRSDMARRDSEVRAADEGTPKAAYDDTSQAAYGKHRELLGLNDDYIREVLFQCLLLDDLTVENGMVYANLYTIYLLR